jgi:hypothetical protein
MRPAPRSDGGKVVFQEVAADGTHVAAEATAGALAAMLEKVGGKDRELSHRIVSVHADCPSAGCSWGSVELERTWRRDGQRMRVPMRATVLVRYQQEAPHMRIFLWHASRTGPEQLLKGAAKGD